MVAPARRWGRKSCERLVYRVAGLPVAVAGLFLGGQSDAAGALRDAYANYFWTIDSAQDLAELLTGSLLWPVGLLAAAIWFTWKNGALIRERTGKPALHQFAEELRAYFSAGVLPPWYYAFELYDGRSTARSYLNRFETKKGYYEVLLRRRQSHSPLGNKLRFEQHCRAYQIQTVPVLAVAAGGEVVCFEPGGLPRSDLFVKPIRGRGGRGAERWDYDGSSGRYGCADREFLGEQLLDRLRRRSNAMPRIVQPRLVNCDELKGINNDALSTVRIVTCLDESGRPEIVGAAVRMAIGDNHRVDNFHAGGIASAVDLDTGELGPASDMGMDARLGWLDRHPDGGGTITGRKLPMWEETCRLAERAHRAFDDRVVVGWDIAVTPQGPTVIEGNSAPDLDIIQRTRRSGLAEGRFAELLAYHVRSGDPKLTAP
jgi:hypothetical protein